MPTPNQSGITRYSCCAPIRAAQVATHSPLRESEAWRCHTKAVNQARHLIYIEDPYLWSPEVATMFAATLQRNPGLHLIAVLPRFPDQDGRISKPPNLVGRERAIATLRKAAPRRVAFYGLESPDGVPVYVHAKVCIIDDKWASAGSDNFNRRSWTQRLRTIRSGLRPWVRAGVAAQPRR
jgi:phosphatidylserine/phosphatidylglycerophosphate/cardiolipin synthase-like enzyme